MMEEEEQKINEDNEIELDLTKVDISCDYQAGSKMRKYDLICFQIIEKNIRQALQEVNLTDLLRMLSIVVTGNTITVNALHDVLRNFFGESKGRQILSWLVLPFFNLPKGNEKDDLHEKESYEEYLTFNLKLIISKELDCFSFMTLFAELDNETGSPKFNLDNIARIQRLDLISVMLFFLFFGNESNDKKAEIFFDLLDYEKTGQLRTGKKVFYVIFRKIILLTLFFSDIIVNYSVHLHSQIPDFLSLIDKEQLPPESTPGNTQFKSTNTFTTVSPNDDKHIFYQAYTDVLFEYKKILFYLRHSRGIMKDLVTFISHSFIFYENMTNPLVSKDLFKSFCKESKYSIFNPGRYREYLITYLFHNQRRSTLFLTEFPRMIHMVEDNYIQANKKNKREQNMMINELNLREEYMKYQTLVHSRENIVKMFINTEKYIQKKDLNDLKRQKYKKQNKMNKRELDKEITEVVERGGKNNLPVQNIINEFNNELERQRDTNDKGKVKDKDVEVEIELDGVDNDFDKKLIPERSKVKSKSNKSNKSSNSSKDKEDSEKNDSKEKDLFKIGKIGQLSKGNTLGQSLTKIGQIDQNAIIDEEEDNFECDNTPVNHLLIAKNATDKLSKLSKSFKSNVNSEMYSVNNNNDEDEPKRTESIIPDIVLISEREKEIDLQRPIYTGSNEPSAIKDDGVIERHGDLDDIDDNDEDDMGDENDDGKKNLKEVKVDNPHMRMFRMPQRKEKFQPNEEQIKVVKSESVSIKNQEEGEAEDEDKDKSEEEEVIKIIVKQQTHHEDSKSDISAHKSIQPIINEEEKVSKNEKSIDITNKSQSKHSEKPMSYKHNESHHSQQSKPSAISKPSIQQQQQKQQQQQQSHISKEPSKKESSDIEIIPSIIAKKPKENKEQEVIKKTNVIPQQRLSANSELFQDKDEFFNNPISARARARGNEEYIKHKPVIDQEDGDEVEEISRHDESFSDTNSEHISIKNLTSQLDIHRRQVAIPTKSKQQTQLDQEALYDFESNTKDKQHPKPQKQPTYEIEADRIFNDYFTSFENYKKTPIEHVQAQFKEVNENLIHQCNINNFTPFFKEFSKTQVYSLINYDFKESLMNLYFKLMTFYNIFLRNSNETNTNIIFLDLSFFQLLQESSHLNSFGTLYKKYESDFMSKGKDNSSSIIFDQPNAMVVVPIYVYINLSNSDSKKLFMALINMGNKSITFFDSDDVLTDNPEVVNNYKILFESFFAYLMKERLSRKDLTGWQCESDSIDSMCYEEEYAVIIMVYYTQLICKTGRIRLISDKEYPIIKDNMFKEIAGFYAKLYQHIK